MHAGDAHQVGDPGVAEQGPLRAGDGVLVADGQRDDHTGVWVPAQGRCQAVADLTALPVDPTAQGALAPLGLDRDAGQHTRGADAALEEPGLIVEAVRVEAGVRRGQFGDKAHTGTSGRRWRRLAAVWRMGEQDTPGHNGIAGVHRRNIDAHTPAPRRALGQVDHTAGEAHRPALPGVRQVVGETGLGPPGGIVETRQAGQQTDEDEAADADTLVHQPQDGHKQPGQHQPEPGMSRQGRLQLQHGRTQGEGKNRQTDHVKIEQDPSRHLPAACRASISASSSPITQP